MNQDLSHELERFRYAVFMGHSPSESITPLTQEEYVRVYEEQFERNPAEERKLIETFSAPLLPTFRKHMEQIAKMEQLLAENREEIHFTDEELLEELYDEVSNLETEEEWQEFKKRFA